MLSSLLGQNLVITSGMVAGIEAGMATRVRVKTDGTAQLCTYAAGLCKIPAEQIAITVANIMSTFIVNELKLSIVDSLSKYCQLSIFDFRIAFYSQHQINSCHALVIGPLIQFKVFPHFFLHKEVILCLGGVERIFNI